MSAAKIELAACVGRPIVIPHHPISLNTIPSGQASVRRARGIPGRLDQVHVCSGDVARVFRRRRIHSPERRGIALRLPRAVSYLGRPLAVPAAGGAS